MLTEDFKDRIIYIEGDITDKNIHDKLSGIHYDTLFNCAALVKHYIVDDELDKVNVDGVRNLINCCIEDNATLIQASTYSVVGFIEQDSPKILDEHHLYLCQSSDNNYVRTKFLAERYLLETVAEGKLKGKIMRLGNLMGRDADGEFQINFGTNAFVNLLKTYIMLGVYPTSQLKTPVEMSPIDEVAEAVVKLATTPEDMIIFHPFNSYKIEIKTIFDAIREIGHTIDYVLDSEFKSKVDVMKNDPEKVKYLQGIMHYGYHNNSNNKVMPTENQWTTAVLDKLGFRWEKTEEEYLIKFLKSLESMQVVGV